MFSTAFKGVLILLILTMVAFHMAESSRRSSSAGDRSQAARCHLQTRESEDPRELCSLRIHEGNVRVLIGRWGPLSSEAHEDMQQRMEEAGHQVLHSFLVSQNVDACNPLHGYTSYWLGATDFGTEGKWLSSVTHKPLRYVDWRKGQPSNGKSEHCAAMIASYYQWYDTSCSTKRSVICQK